MKLKVINGGCKKRRRTSSYIVHRDPQKNVVSVRIVESYGTNIDHLYRIAHNLPLNEKSREELIWFMDRTRDKGKTYWVMRMINTYLNQLPPRLRKKIQ